MKTYKIVGCAIIASVIMSSINLVYANEPAKVALRVGIVNQQVIFEESSLGKKMRNKLQGEIESKQKEFNGRQVNLQKKQEELSKNKDIMTEKEREHKEGQLMRAQKDMQKLYDQMQGELEDKKQEETQKFDKLFAEAVSAVAKAENIDLVLPDNVILYANNKLDLTSKVLAAVNSSHAAK